MDKMQRIERLPQNWLIQLRQQCLRLAAHPQLDVKQAMYAVGTLLSKIQHCIDEDRLNAGLVESMGESMLRLADAGELQLQIGQLMPIPMFRAEALQQLPASLAGPQTQELCWAQQDERVMQPFMKSLLQGLLADNAFYDPRSSFGEIFARLSQYLFWVRQSLALTIQAGNAVTPAQLAIWDKTLRCGVAEVLPLADNGRLSSDIYLLKGLALL